MQKLTILVVLLILLSSLSIGALEAQEISSPQEVITEQSRLTPHCLPGQFMVKLCQGENIKILGELNAKYNITAEKVISPDTPLEETLKQLKDKLTILVSAHESWYWQLDKNSSEYINYQERIGKEKQELQARIKGMEELLEHIAQRQKRAPLGGQMENSADFYLLKTGGNQSLPEVIAEYNQHPGVEYAEPNYIYPLSYIPNDPRYPDQWAHKKTAIEQGWDIARGSSEVIIAVIDSGVDYNHEDLKENIWKDPVTGAPGKDLVDIDTSQFPLQDGNITYSIIAGEDYTTIDDDPMDSFGHGTHVAGIAAARGDNRIGIIGACPNCKIMPLRMGFKVTYPSIINFPAPWGGSIPLRINTTTALCDGASIIRAIYWAVEHGADVVNMSFGSAEPSLAVKSALGHAYSQGVVLVAAAGNNNSSAAHYPASYDFVLSVASLSLSAQGNPVKSTFSSYGPTVDVCAPGGHILSTLPEQINSNKYDFKDGTSMAAPYVSGLAALLISFNPVLKVDEVYQKITASADDLGAAGRDDYYGCGKVNAAKMIALANTVTAPNPPQQAPANPPVCNLVSAPANIAPLQEVVIQARFSDPNGTGDIAGTQIDIGDSIYDYRCQIAYHPDDKELYLSNNRGGWLGPVVIGSSVILDNGYAKLDCSRSTSSIANMLALNLNLQFYSKPDFQGNKGIFALVADKTGINSGWQNQGNTSIQANPPVTVPPVNPPNNPPVNPPVNPPAGPNQPPIARIQSMIVSNTRQTISFSFSAAQSADSDGQIVEYRWVFGDGESALGKETTHTYLRTGAQERRQRQERQNYTVILTVTDNRGSRDSASKIITID